MPKYFKREIVFAAAGAKVRRFGRVNKKNQRFKPFACLQKPSINGFYLAMMAFEWEKKSIFASQ